MFTMPEKVKKLKNALNRPKTIDEILNEQIRTAMHEHDRPNLNLFLSSISAGLEIGFSIFLMAAVYSLSMAWSTPRCCTSCWPWPIRWVSSL
jgi:hypothetical protein